MKQLAQFITWPAITGVLAAVIILQWQTTERQPQQPLREGISSFADAVQKAAPSVVNIYTRKHLQASRHPLANDPFFRRFFTNGDRRRERVQRSLGSGVIVAASGLILTNRHVIAEADEILVLLQDGRDSLATVLGSDENTDLAVLQVTLDDMQAISMGTPDEARVGDVVLAIGNPYGFGHSVSQGIISALGRYGLSLSKYEYFIQTDAAVNLGNSGGALIDTRGQLVGINTATYSPSGSSVGIGLAIPSDVALTVMQDLVTYGKWIRGWMGLEVQPLISDSIRGGQTLQVIATYPGGPADKAGIQPGDVITHIDMQPVVDGRYTMQKIALLRPGDAIEITLRRDSQALNLQVIVGTQPDGVN